MNSPAHDLVLYLVSQGVGAFGGEGDWSLHVSGEPATPENVITLYDTAGGDLDTDEQDVWQPSIQVRVRGKNYNAAYQKQVVIQKLLTRPGLDPVIDAETSRFTGVMMTSDVLSLGRDENKLYLLTANYRARRTEKEL